MGPWGGGVDPDLVFVGYNRPSVFKADTIIVTFLIQNQVDKEKLKPALEWEKKYFEKCNVRNVTCDLIKFFFSRFIQYIKNYDQNLKPDFMDLTYSSERSIEDELERVSQAEAGTAIISYLVMFVYIALSLGNIRSFKTILVNLLLYFIFYINNS